MDETWEALRPILDTKSGRQLAYLYMGMLGFTEEEIKAGPDAISDERLHELKMKRI